MNTFKGVVVYEILPNGCLNGVYSNDAPATNNEIFNEIARRTIARGEISGDYICSYIDVGNNVYIRDLVINLQNNQFQFLWYEQGTGVLVHEGVGWKTRSNQLTVNYWDAIKA